MYTINAFLFFPPRKSNAVFYLFFLVNKYNIEAEMSAQYG